MAESKMVAAEGKKTKMVKVRAIRDFTYKTGKRIDRQLPNGNVINVDEELHAVTGTVVEMPEEIAEAVCAVFTGTYAFGGERAGLEGKQRHAIRRGEIIGEAASAA